MSESGKQTDRFSVLKYFPEGERGSQTTPYIIPAHDAYGTILDATGKIGKGNKICLKYKDHIFEMTPQLDHRLALSPDDSPNDEVIHEFSSYMRQLHDRTGGVSRSSKPRTFREKVQDFIDNL